LAKSPLTRVIVLTGHGGMQFGVRALQAGAAHFVEKPAHPAHVAALIIDAARQYELRRECERLRGQRVADLQGEFVGRSIAAVRLREQIAFLGSASVGVVLLGETGTGKGKVARLIHAGSVARRGRFVHYQPNFAGSDLMQTELCGHLKGAYTGADEARSGLVVEADGGTLFIDELDELPSETQVRLLDIIQEQRVRAVGADTFRSVDVRWIAASNRPIEESLAAGRVRRDLYHRLAQCVVTIPPLRERLEDIPDLCASLLADLQAKDGTNVFAIERAAYAALTARAWPGNVRELFAVVTTAAHRAAFRGSSKIAERDLELGAMSGDIATAVNAGFKNVGPPYAWSRPGSFREVVEAFKAQYVQAALRGREADHSQVAFELGMDRKTLRRVLRASSKSGGDK
jgi:DNA-binding NtrC family response regulator